MRRLLLWLLVPALPLGVILGVLALQDPPVPPRAVAPVETLAADDAPAAKKEWSFKLLRADGSPATDGVVIVLEPAVTSAAVQEDGNCRFTVRSDQPVRLLAWAPDHRVREVGPWESPPLELRLDAVESLPPAEPSLRLARLQLLLTRPDGSVLANALVLVRPEAEPDAAPWMAFSDASGAAECEVENVSLFVQVYAPGRAPRPAWLLASSVRSAGGDVTAWEIAAAELELSGLPAMEPVQLRRDGEVLDLRAAGEDGLVRWDALAPGAWEIGTSNGRMRLSLETGIRRVAWVPDPGS